LENPESNPQQAATDPEAHRTGPRDRRRAPRGGRREYDQPGRSPSVLVADSYAGARRPFVRYLERYHFDVVEATSGEEALAHISTHPPRIVLIEWDLPMLGDAQLSEWLIGAWRRREVQVIAMAGDRDAHAPMLRADGVLMKPFSLVAMLEEIRRVLR
jgi:DNA-binding response OmpR family regulator